MLYASYAMFLKQRAFSCVQRKLQKVARDVVSPKALCCLNRGKLIPDLLHFNSPKVECRLMFVNFIVTCKNGIRGWLYFVSKILTH